MLKPKIIKFHLVGWVDASKPNIFMEMLSRLALKIVVISNWTKIFTVIASEGKQSQPLQLFHFTSFHMANATQRLRNDIV
jgi:hypothetical protein